MSICTTKAVKVAAFSYYPSLRRLEEYCLEHYEQYIDLAQAAELCALERTYFCTFFHEKVGVCFKCWLGLLRVEQAKQLIKTKNLAISRIGLDVGFKSLSSFERTFKRATGRTPFDYKQLHKPS